MGDDTDKRFNDVYSTISDNLKQSLDTENELFKEIDRLENLIGASSKAFDKEVADVTSRVKELEGKVADRVW